MSYHKGIIVFVNVPRSLKKFRADIRNAIKAQLPGVSVKTWLVSGASALFAAKVFVPDTHPIRGMRPNGRGNSSTKPPQSDAHAVLLTHVEEILAEIDLSH